MNRLKITLRKSKETKNAVILELEGVFDESAVSLFHDLWRQIPDQANIPIILNFHRVSEMNNFGAGFLAGLMENTGRSGGEFVLVDVPAAVKQTLMAVRPPLRQMRFYETEASITDSRLPPNEPAFFNHFVLIPQTSEIISGLPFPLRIEARNTDGRLFSAYGGTPHMMSDRGMISPTLLHGFSNGVWEGQVIVTAPGLVKLKIWDNEGAGEQDIEVSEKGLKVEFPIQVSCPGCGKVNVAGKADIFRCIKCNYIYFIDIRGHLVPLKSGNHTGTEKVLEFNIPSDINYLNHVRNFIVGVSREENISEDKVAQIEMSLDEALANVVEHAYTFDCHQDIQVRVGLYSDRLVIVIRDHGRSFNSEQTPLPNIKEHIEQRRVGGLGRYLMKTLMDEVEYRSDSVVNELRMVKRF